MNYLEPTLVLLIGPVVGLVRGHTQDTGPLSDVSSILEIHGPKIVATQLMVVKKLMMVTGD